jgi:hypothetical protein
MAIARASHPGNDSFVRSDLTRIMDKHAAHGLRGVQ